MTADSDLPVWSIRPNWTHSITETLEWLSDVLANSYGVEQVRALRLSPRRMFEMTFNPVNQERAFFDLWLERMGSDEFMLPLFHDHALLTADIAAGATVIPFDTTYREFEVGGLAILLGADAFTFDKVTIQAIADNSITVSAGGVTRAWPSGSSIHPLRRARLEDKSSSDAITGVLGQATLRFELNQENDIADEGTWDVMYGDYPLILDEPNRRENIKVTFNGQTILVDNDVGLREMVDDAGRSFTLQTHLMMLDGRAEQWAFRQMLYRLRGQQGAVWLPTFNADLELSRDRAAGDALLDFKKIGYAYTGGVLDGRDHVLINGSIPRRITGVGVAPSATEERVFLDSSLGAALLATGATASFIDTCRLGSDSVQIDHITDSDGVAESSLSFQAFRDQRTTPDPLDSPIPAASQGLTMCGSAAADSADCLGIESGWWFEIVIDTTYGPIIGDAAHNHRAHTYPGFGFTLYDAAGVAIPIGRVLQTSEGDLYTEDAPNSLGQVGKLTLRLPVSSHDPTDPLAAQPSGLPHRIHVFMQFTYGMYSFPEGDGTAILTFRRPNETAITLTRQDVPGWEGMEIFGLWPTDYDMLTGA